MKVSNRQRRILEVLLNRPSEVTAGQLAQEVQISARTVHRELQELEPLLPIYGVSLVKKSGIGISLEGPEYLLSRFQEELRRSETETYSPEERKVLMLCTLLEEAEPVKLFTLAREVHAAIPTVSRDFDELEPQLIRCNLKLVRKRGYGVEIAGTESAKRQFIVWLAEEYLDHSDWFGTPEIPSEQPPVSRRLLDLVGKDTFLQIEQSLWQQAEEWLNALIESDYTRLLIRLSVAVTRIRRKYGVHTKPDNGQPVAGKSAASRSFGISIDLKRFANALGLELSDGEAAYLRHLFEEAREKAGDVSSVILEKYGLELAERTIEFMGSVEKRMGVKFDKDHSLLDGLIRHLGPALERIRRRESIRNPLLSQIKKDYEVLFSAVNQGASETWRDLAIPGEEIGYLTMHFGAAMERWKLMPGGLKALLVCTSGIGSSKLLAVRISKEIPQIDLVGHYSWYEASRVPEDQYDLIISTVDLPVESDRYIKISPLLTREETEKLRSRIQGVASTTRKSLLGERAEERGAWERLKLMARYSSVMVRLLEPFHVYDMDNHSYNGELERLLTGIIGKLSPQFALEHEELIVMALMDREIQGSLLIPDTELALFHTRSVWVSEPILALIRLKSPQPMGDDPAAQACQILLMLAPKSLSKEALEVLSEISAMLLLPELIRLLEDDEEMIRAFLSRHLEVYIKNKLEWRDSI
jgi:mannitol operon transcriptional antiterminator